MKVCGLFSQLHKMLYFMAFFGLILSSRLWAAELQIKAKGVEFSIDVSSDWQVGQDASAAALLFLRHSLGKFPTFNMVVVEAPYKLKSPINSQIEEVLSSYRGIGLTSVAVRRAGEVRYAERVFFELELVYVNESLEFLSQVTIIPMGTRHLIATFIDTAAGYQQNVSLAQELLNSLKLEGTEGTEQPLVQFGLLYWLAAIAAVALFLRELVKRQAT